MLRLVAAGAALAVAVLRRLGGRRVRAERVHRPGHDRRSDLCDRLGQRQPERHRDDVVRRVRHDARPTARRRPPRTPAQAGQRRGLADALESQARHDLPLPRRRDERAGTGRGADGLLTTSSARRSSPGARAASPRRRPRSTEGQPEQPCDDVVLRDGTSTSYGTKTAAKDAGSGTARSMSPPR